MSKIIRCIVLVAIVFIGGTIVGSTPAQALPYPGSNETVHITYYDGGIPADPEVLPVGGKSYGNCGQNYQWGKTTPYYTIKYTSCLVAKSR
jgi:hypothetical protein